MINKRGQIQQGVVGVQQPAKKSKAWLWITLVIILLIAVGAGIYFLVGSDGGIGLGSGGLPKPPALPE